MVEKILPRRKKAPFVSDGEREVIANIIKKLYDNLFEKWHYRRDPTHVVFYNEETFKVIAKARNWNYEIIKKDIVLFYKN